jgi:hypothetical protein
MGNAKKYFDNNVLGQYLDDFQGQFGMTRDRLWAHVAVVLVVGKSTGWRWFKQVGRLGMQESADPDPMIKPMLRYIAATNRKIAVPEGRDVVLRSLAATLTYIRAQSPGSGGEEITAREVELLRYAMEHRGYIDKERGITEKMIDRMQADIGHALRITGDRSKCEAVAEVRRVVKDWLPTWLLLTEALPYMWIYYNHEAR